MIKKNVIILFLFISGWLSAQTNEFTGYCSFYGDEFHGRHTASGEKYDKNALTAAHRTLPFNTVLEVTNLRNNKKIWVRVNDRGPHVKNRVLDISKAAAIHLDMVAYGVEKVKVKVVDSATAAMFLDTLRNYSYKPSDIKTDAGTTGTTEVELKSGLRYDHLVNAVNPAGYGLQVGYYESKVHALAAQKKYFKDFATETYIYVEKKSTGNFYRIILGAFANKEQAEALRKKVSIKIKGCTIISWSSF